MPTIFRPRNDEQRTSALSTCFIKAQNTPQAAWLITAAQNNAINTLLPIWRGLRNSAAVGLYNQTNATAVASEAWQKLAQIIRHYIQVLNFAIDRGVIPASVRAYYQLPVSHAEVPPINTAVEALRWAQNLSSGEASRVSTGGAPMAWPSIADVDAAATAFSAAEAAQSTAKSAFDVLQEAVAAKRPEVDALVKDLWDTIEFNLRNEAAASMRRKAREWGVVYADDASGAPIPLEISNLTGTGATSVLVNYATTGGEGATTEFLQYKLPGETDFGHDTPLVRPVQTVSNPAFEQALITFRTKLVNAEGTTYGTPVEIGL